MTKSGFINTAKHISFTVSDTPVVANPKRFSQESGRVGWNINAQLLVPMPDGTMQVARFSGNIILSNSNKWPETDSGNLALAAPNGTALAKAS